jgi:glycyl-tRNA synthetase
MKHSWVDMQYHDPVTGARYVPHIIETALWVGRAMFVAMADAYDEEKYTDGNWEEATRTVLRFHKNLAPIKFAILPLIKKDEQQVKIATDIFKKLSADHMCEYDDGWAIGKRYRRQDEIGTPYCITVDHQTIEDGTVTLRDRDTMAQKRVKIEEIVY